MDYLRTKEVRKIQILRNCPIHLDSIRRIIPFQIRDRWFLFSGSEDKTIKLWNVSYTEQENTPECKF